MLFREAGAYGDRKQDGTATRDANGVVALMPPDAGRRRTATPRVADACTSFAATLAFEML